MMEYILNDDHTTKKATIEEYLEQYKKWAEAGPFVKGHPKVVDKTTVRNYEVSTVFLGIDHSYSFEPDHVPILFETMIFASDDDPLDNWCYRYPTWDEAQQGHDLVVSHLEIGDDTWFDLGCNDDAL